MVLKQPTTYYSIIKGLMRPFILKGWVQIILYEEPPIILDRETYICFL